MRVDKKTESEVLKMYDIWLHSYLNGDVETYNSYLDNEFHFIGSTNSEEFLDRKSTTDFFKATAEQLSGKSELRNETKILEQYGALIFITHLFDAWFLNGEEWVYYNRFRFTNALQKNKEGWRFVYQHYSVPDGKTEEGETIGYDNISAENLQLREAIKRRTVELETKNRELEIEAALERTRTQSMLMQHSIELNKTSQVFHEQLHLLGIDSEFSYLWLPDEKKSNHVFWATWFEKRKGNRVYNNKSVIYPLDKKEPAIAECYVAWESGEPVHINPVSPKEVSAYFDTWKELLDGIKKFKPELYPDGLYYIDSYMRYGCFGIMIKRTLTEDEKIILSRFSKEFERTYIRFLDLQKAEAQTREAKIEASLEKVRNVALTLKKSDDMLDIAKALYEQLLVLGFTDIRNAIIDIHNDATETFLDYDYSHDMSSAVTEFSFYGDPVIEQQIKQVQSSNDAFFEIELKGEQLKELIETRLKNGEKDDPRLHETEHLTYNLYSFGNGAIGISNFGILSDDQKKILKRFRNVFTFAYKRYTDLANAEAQALEAKIEASLEKVRNVALGMKQSDHLLDIVKALYEQLLELGFNDIRNALIDVNNEDDKTFMDYDYSHEMGGTVTQMSYDDDPTLEEQLRVIAKTTDGYSEMVLEGQQLQDLIDMRRNNGEADDPRLSNTESVSYILYAFGNGAIGISNFGILSENQKSILSRFRNVFTFAYQRYTDLAQSEAQAAALLAEKQRLEVTLSDLQATQKQLIQSEKMASLGELTAGIAHEIQNPLNFVNNFSEVSNELMDEMNEEIEKGDLKEAKIIANDIKQNLEKITHHGKRADAIVKGMLQHSRKSSAEKVPTDINKLADEYLRLAYHGLRAKDKTFNATLKTDFDDSIGLVKVIPQDLGRVILNLITNAFYAVNKKNIATLSLVKGQRNASTSSARQDFKPTVSVATKMLKDQVIISVKDNGNGIPKQVLDKIFQPFFTTKPTGEGTGLGLSMSYDIVKAHGGKIEVASEENIGTSFRILLPLAIKQ